MSQHVDVDQVIEHTEPDPGILDRPSPTGRARTPLERLRAALVTGDQIKELPRTAPLIEGVLDLDSTAVLYGRPGIGKSFIALDWGLSVATQIHR